MASLIYSSPLEKVKTNVFLKSLLDRDVNQIERDLIALPARLGGLGIFNPVTMSAIFHMNSITISEPLVQKLIDQDTRRFI